MPRKPPPSSKRMPRRCASVELTPGQFKFIRSIASRAKTVQQIMDEQEVTPTDLARWLASEKFRKHLNLEHASADQWQQIERKFSRAHATETIARVARGLEVGEDTRLCLQAAMHIVNAGKKRKAAGTPPPPLQVQHDEATTRALLDILNKQPAK